MAKITPIDIIKGVSGKFGGNSREYFATNKTSYNIYFAKRVNDFQGPATQKQLEIRDRFKRKQKAVADWLRANRPMSGRPATEAYRVALALKYRYKFSSINQVIHKYLNDDLQVVLPNVGSDNGDAPNRSRNARGQEFPQVLYILTQVSPFGRVFKIHDFFLHGFEDVLMLLMVDIQRK